MRRLITDRDIASALNVHRLTVWRWVREGRLAPPIRIGPNCSRWEESVIDELVSGAIGAGEYQGQGGDSA